MAGQEVDQSEYIDNAMRAMQNKKQVPEIDFTLHTMEDGTQVSTQERVCKGMCCPTSPRCSKSARGSVTANDCAPQTYKRPPSARPPKSRLSPHTTDQSQTWHSSSNTSTEKVV